MKRMFTASEFAEMTGMSTQKVCKLIAAKKLRAIDISTGNGRKPRWGIPIDSSEEFLSGGTLTPVSPAPKQVRRQRLDANVPKVFG